MYAIYAYSAGSTIADITYDLTLLLTGTTDTALLSNSCDKVLTSITTTNATAGWTLYDNATGTANLYVITAPNATATTTKYLQVFANTSTSIILRTLWGWNPSTNTPDTLNTNYVSWLTVNPTSGGRIYISSTQKTILMLSWDSAVYRTFAGSVEWNNQWGAANRSIHGVIVQFDAGGLQIATAKTKNQYADGDVTNGYVLGVPPYVNWSTNAGASTVYRTENESVYLMVFDFLIISSTRPSGFAYDLKVIGGSYQPLDEIIIGSDTYVNLQKASNASALLVRKG